MHPAHPQISSRMGKEKGRVKEVNPLAWEPLHPKALRRLNMLLILMTVSKERG